MIWLEGPSAPTAAIQAQGASNLFPLPDAPGHGRKQRHARKDASCHVLALA
ncbi:hypothetical protein ACTNC1_05260 [Atopobiaceae bacterium HCP3S3_A4]